MNDGRRIQFRISPSGSDDGNPDLQIVEAEVAERYSQSLGLWRRYPSASIAAGSLLLFASLGIIFSSYQTNSGPKGAVRVELPAPRSSAGDNSMTARNEEQISSDGDVLDLEPIAEGLELEAPAPQAVMPIADEPIAEANVVDKTLVGQTSTLIYDSFPGQSELENQPVVPEQTTSPSESRKAASSDPNRLIRSGTIIPAVLETPIDEREAGGVRARVNLDIRTVDGDKVLIPHSSRLIGRYVTKREGPKLTAYVVWDRFAPPNGRSVNIGENARINGDLMADFAQSNLQSIVILNSSEGANGSTSQAVRVRRGQPVRVRVNRDVAIQQEK